MRIPFDYLLENLRCGENFQVVGRPVLSAYMARPKFLLSDAPLEPGRLYISFTEELPCSVEKQPSSSAILTAPDPARLFNQLQELYDRCEAWEEALCNAASGGELRELLDEVESILDNPILLHKSNYAIVACSGEVFSNPALAALRGSHLPYDYVNTLKRDPVFEQSRTASAPFFYSNPFTKTPALGMNLLQDADMSYRLTAIPLLRPLTDSDRFLMTLCAGYVTQVLNSTILTGRYDDPSGRRERLTELFRMSVENENTDQTVLDQGFSSLGWLTTHQYCCVSIQIGSQDYLSHTAELLRNQLEALLPASCVFSRLGTMAVLINLTLAGSSIRELLEKCVYFFRDNDLRSGVSNPFTGFRELRHYHKQSLIALDFASRPQAFLWTQYFSDVVLDYILEQSNRELPLHLICSQRILQIRQYDAEHQTDFYITLECYIRNKFNAVQTAKELQIHRSTFLYRMERLQTLFGLDLNQRDALLYVLLSMKMLELSKFMMLHE